MRKSPELDELIRALEKEKRTLTKAMNECIQEHDFKFARKYQKGLIELSARLNTLYSFRDPNARKITDLSEHRKYLMKHLTDYKDNEFLINRLLDKTNELAAEIQNLESQKHQPFQDSQHIDDAMFDLVEERIDAFQLNFKEGKIQIKFQRCPGRLAEISIGPVKMLRNSFLIVKNSRREILNMGFTLDNSGDRYVYRYDLTHFRDALFIKTLLGRLIYDVFAQLSLGAQSEVELERL